MTVVELGEKGNVALREIPFLPLRDVRLLEGTLARLTDPATVKNGNAEDYVSVILTDEEELYDPRSALEQCYPNLLEWRVENSRTRHAVEDMVLPDMNLSPIELFEEFYRMMQEIKQDQDCFSLRDLAVNGSDLMQLGFPQDKSLGNALNALLELVMDDKMENDKNKLLIKAKELLDKGE